jgi:hypothetical protein
MLEVGGDIQPFLDAGYQGIYFMEHYINPNYHAVTDLVENCDFLYLAEVTRVNLGMILYSDIYTGYDEDITAEGTLNIFPNPAERFLEFRLDVSNHLSTYKIVNVNGAILESGYLHPGTYHRLDAGHLSGGIYFLIVDGQEKSFRSKVIRK